jgi:hypothetical protein
VKPNRPLLIPGLVIGVGGLLAVAVALKVCGSRPVVEPTSPEASFAPAPPPRASASSTPDGASSAEVEPHGKSLTAPSVPQTYVAAQSNSADLHPLGIPLRAMDREILERIAKNDIKRLDDALPGKPYRVQMSRNAADGYIVLVRIDMTRKNALDERWKLTHDAVTREVIHANDPSEIDTFALRNGHWVPF